MENLKNESLYDFSFEKMQQELNVEKKFNYDEYGSMSTLEWLCKEHIGTHKIENFDLIEWKKYRITSSNLEDICKWVGDEDAQFRLLNYFCNNPPKVIADDYLVTHPDEIEQFPDQCCYFMYGIHKSWKPLQYLPTREGYEPIIGFEHMPDLEVIGGVKPKKPIVQGTKGYEIGRFSRMVVSRGTVRKYFPMYDNVCLEYINKAVPYNPNILFSDESILEVIFLTRNFIEIDIKSYTKYPDDNTIKERIVNFFKALAIEFFIRYHLSRDENRMLYGKKEPVIKVFFGLCAYFETDEFTEEEQKYISPLCSEIRKYLSKNSSNRLILSILDECIQAFKEEAQKRLEEEQAKEQAANAEKAKQEAKNILNDKELRVERLREVNKALRENRELHFEGEPAQWFWIFRRMADNGIYELTLYQPFFNELKEAGVDAKINKSLFTRYNNSVKGNYIIEGWTPGKRMRQSTLDKGKEIAKAAGLILFKQ